MAWLMGRNGYIMEHAIDKHLISHMLVSSWSNVSREGGLGYPSITYAHGEVVIYYSCVLILFLAICSNLVVH